VAAAAPFQLDSERIVETVHVLSKRIHERFPGAGLHTVCRHLLEIARQAKLRAQQIAEPITWVRVLSGMIILVIALAFVATLVLIVRGLVDESRALGTADVVQMLDAAFNSLLLIGATVVFLITLETRIKRRRALKALHELRAIAHVIDMHQLTKDPERVAATGSDTQSSPKRTMTAFELSRYLDYSSEMLSLTGKIAALYAQKFDDANVVAAVNDIEDLTSGLSRKIWQKIMILHDAEKKGTT
jgi:hypothetical protein